MLVLGLLGGRILIGDRERRAARRLLRFHPDELAVAQAQQTLIDPDCVGAHHEIVGVHLPAFPDQRFGVDNDLSLAAEIGGHGLLRHQFEPVGGRRHRAGPAQNDTGAAHHLRAGRARVGDRQLRHQIAARLKPECSKIEVDDKAAALRIARAGDHAAAFGKADILTLANRGGEGEAGHLIDGVIIARLEHHAPAPLSRLDHHQTRRWFDHLHLRRFVDDGFKPVRRLRHPGFLGGDMIERGDIEPQRSRPPFLAQR